MCNFENNLQKIRIFVDLWNCKGKSDNHRTVSTVGGNGVKDIDKVASIVFLSSTNKKTFKNSLGPPRGTPCVIFPCLLGWVGQAMRSRYLFRFVLPVGRFRTEGQ